MVTFRNAQYRAQKQKKRSSLWGRRGLLMVGCLALCCAGPSVFAAKGEFAEGTHVISSLDRMNHDPTFILTLGKADIVTLQGDAADILVANPDVVDVVALQPNKLYFVGQAIGDTNVIIMDEAGDVIRRMNVHVRVDESTLQSSLGSLFPDESVIAKTVNDQIVLSGKVSSPSVATKIQDFATRFMGGDGSTIVNLLDFDGEQQVMLRVKIMEASRSVLRELGIETSLADTGNGNLSGSVNVNSRTGLTQDSIATASAIFDDGSFGPLQVLLNLLEEDGLVSTLAEPNLTAVSGEEAGFLAGGEYPVPSGRDQVGNITIEFREFGVSLNFRPLVLSNDRISLQLETEVSSLDNENAVTLDSLSVPGLDIRRASTTVELSSGSSLMIAGILQSQAIEGLNGIPGISDTPILGDLIRSESFQRNETELIVMVTTYIVKPFADEKYADKTPKERNGKLTKLFVANLRRSYQGLKLDDPMFETDDQFGYIIE